LKSASPAYRAEFERAQVLKDFAELLELAETPASLMGSA
jgi:hypothetical protein